MNNNLKGFKKGAGTTPLLLCTAASRLRKFSLCRNTDEAQREAAAAVRCSDTLMLVSVFCDVFTSAK